MADFQGVRPRSKAANPIAAPAVDSLHKIRRDVFCPRYDRCLDFAIGREWENFSCTSCGLFKDQKAAAEQWLVENTIACALGRVSPRQCEVNRGRRRIGEPLDLRARDAEGNRVRPAGGVRPLACEACTDYERLIDEFDKRRHEEVSNMETVESALPAPSSTPGLCICKKCRGEFEPYRRGAVTVKTICAACQGSNSSRKGRSESLGSANKIDAEAQDGKGCTVTLSFIGADAGLLARIADIAREKRRPVDAQILRWLEKEVPELRGWATAPARSGRGRRAKTG